MFLSKLFKKKEPDNTIVLSTMDDMFRWLDTMKAEMDPIITPVLQSQLQLLQTMQNPIVQSMSIDTLMMSLYKTLQVVDNEDIKVKVRDCYTVMLQTLMMFNETVFRYQISKNKQQSDQLLISAGDNLADSISNLGALIFSIKGLFIIKARNVYKMTKECSNFYKSTRAREVCKNNIAELKQEYQQMLEHLFEMLEKYGSLLGESIVLYGMSHRYYSQLTAEYKTRKCEPLLSKMKKANLGKTVSIVSKIKESGIGSVLSSLFSNTTTSVEKDNLDVDEVIKMWGNLDELIDKSKNKIQGLQTEIEGINSEIKQQSIFAFGKRKKLRLEIEQKQNEISNVEQQIALYNDNKRSIEAVYQEAIDIFKDIEQYDKKYLQIVNQFAISTSI